MTLSQTPAHISSGSESYSELEYSFYSYFYLQEYN